MAGGVLRRAAASWEAVTETFLHETAISVPQLWRLSDRLPAHALSLVGNREGARPKD
jgi:hypothetical protein